MSSDEGGTGGVAVRSAAMGLVAIGGAPEPSTTAIRFAIPAPEAGPSMRLGEVRVLTSRVNLLEPITVDTSGSDVTVTVASYGHRGWTFAIDPVDLAPHAVTAIEYDDHAGLAHPGRARSGERVRLHDRRTLGVWTDERSSRVLAQIFDADGSAHGPEIAISGRSDVLGPPHAVTSNGRHVVIAYVTSTRAGFALVARALEAP